MRQLSHETAFAGAAMGRPIPLLLPPMRKRSGKFQIDPLPIIGLSLHGLKDMGKNGIQHVAAPTEKQRAIVNGCLENASRAMVNRLAEEFSPFMRTKGPVQ